MGKFMEQILAEGENIVCEAKPHWMVSAGAFFFAVLFLLFLIPTILFSARLYQEGGLGDVALIALIAIDGILFFAAVIGGINALIYMMTSEYVVTNKRAIFKSGLIRRRVAEVQLSKIESFEVCQGLAGRLFNYGTVLLGGTGGVKVRFDYMGKPYEFKKQVAGQTG